MFKKFFQRGQAAVLYALLIPLLFLFVGVGIDLGWHYLNVSRLQNAADVAVVAGAQKIIADTNFSEYKSYSLVSNRSLQEDQKFSPNSKQESSIPEINGIAEEYAVKNFGETRTIQAPPT